LVGLPENRIVRMGKEETSGDLLDPQVHVDLAVRSTTTWVKSGLAMTFKRTCSRGRTVPRVLEFGLYQYYQDENGNLSDYPERTSIQGWVLSAWLPSCKETHKL